MANVTVDARGRSCPEPVIMTKNALKSADTLEVMVDNQTALENVSRFLRKSGKDVSHKEVEDYFVISAK